MFHLGWVAVLEGLLEGGLPFLSQTYPVMRMVSPPRSSFPASAATLINIRNARKHFEKLERVDGPKHSLLVR